MWRAPWQARDARKAIGIIANTLLRNDPNSLPLVIVCVLKGRNGVGEGPHTAGMGDKLLAPAARPGGRLPPAPKKKGTPEGVVYGAHAPRCAAGRTGLPRPT
eukprot:753321-Prorocentrum_minimum.AAC.1